MSVPMQAAVSSRGLRTAIPALLLALIALLVWGARPAEAGQAWPRDLAGYPVALHFAEPAPEGATTAERQDMTILNEAKRLLDRARGSTSPTGAPQAPDWVGMAIHSITWKPLAESMVAAANRGVQILAVGQYDKRNGTTDPDPTDSNPYDRRYAAVKYLDDYFKDANGQPRMRWCASPGGCISTSTTGSMHAKFITLTGTNDPSEARRTNVSWISSANFTGNTGYEKWNNSLTTYGDSSLMNKLNEIFQHMWHQSVRTTNYYNPALSPPRGYVVAPTGTLHASPEQDTDLVEEVLSRITPASTACRVRVVHMHFSSRTAVVDELRRLKKQGCVVQIISNEITDAMYSQLTSTTRTTGEAIGASNIRETKYSELHDKYIVYYDGNSTSPTYRVLTGSHNLTGDANYDNDEVLFRTVTNKVVHDEYYWHFSRLWARAAP